MKSETACEKASAWWWRKKLVQKLAIINWRGEAFLSWCTSKVAFIFIVQLLCHFSNLPICKAECLDCIRERSELRLHFSNLESWWSNAIYAEYTEMYLIPEYCRARALGSASAPGALKLGAPALPPLRRKIGSASAPGAPKKIGSARKERYP